LPFIGRSKFDPKRLGRRYKIAKIVPLACKMSALAQIFLYMRTHHRFWKIRSFCTKNCGRPHL